MSLTQSLNTELVSSIKKCPRCKETKPVSAFSRNRNRKDGLSSVCVDCHNAYSKTWRKSERGKASHQKALLKHRFGIGWDEFNRLMEFQGGRCAICRGIPPNRRLDIDHNHVSGAIRGLLCNRCNQALGLLFDNPILFEVAHNYLVRGKAVGK